MCWSHGGYWGVWMIYCPDNDVAVAIAWNNAEAKGRYQVPAEELSKAIEDIEAAAASRR